jgi:hypothetical protein
MTTRFRGKRGRVVTDSVSSTSLREAVAEALVQASPTATKQLLSKYAPTSQESWLGMADAVLELTERDKAIAVTAARDEDSRQRRRGLDGWERGYETGVADTERRIMQAIEARVRTGAGPAELGVQEAINQGIRESLDAVRGVARATREGG